MRYFIFFLLLIAIVLLYFSGQLISVSKEAEIIVWQESKPLTWEDFKGKPQKRFAAASTHYNIRKYVNKGKQKDSATIEIMAVFFCEQSWKKEKWVNESVLRHEQKHFDIVELYARKLRKLIKDESYLSFDVLEQKSDSLYAMIDKEMDAYQDLYDDETDGSMNGEQQRLWEEKIMDAIHNLNDYAGTSLNVFVKKNN